MNKLARMIFGEGMQFGKLTTILIGFFLFIIFVYSTSFIVPPGHRGILVTMGRVSPAFAPEGFGFKTPFITTVLPISVRQQTRSVEAECYSSDLQQVKVELRVLYRIPESHVVQIYREYSGDPFDALIAPRVQESVKESTAQQSAEMIVKKREEIKITSLESARKKISGILEVDDLVIQNISLSPELEHAIEAKMVQEQEAAKSKFTQQKAEIDAKTAVIKAQGEAQAIRIRGEALKENPALVHLQIVEKWDGKAPLVVGGGGSGASMILPISPEQRK